MGLSRFEERLVKHYLAAGEIFGNVISYIYSAKGSVPDDFEEMLKNFEKIFKRWARWERKYIKEGFKAYDLDLFIEYGGLNNPFRGHLGEKRKENEEPVSHAETYKKYFLDAVRNCVDFSNGLLKIPRGSLTFPNMPGGL